MKQFGINPDLYWIWQVATVRSINHNVGALKEQSCGCKYKHRRANHCNTSVLLANFFLVVCSLLCRYIKLSSPNLNNVTIVGCIMGYSTVFLSGLDGRLSNSMYTYACRVRQNPAFFLTFLIATSSSSSLLLLFLLLFLFLFLLLVVGRQGQSLVPRLYLWYYLNNLYLLLAECVVRRKLWTAGVFFLALWPKRGARGP